MQDKIKNTSMESKHRKIIFTSMCVVKFFSALLSSSLCFCLLHHMRTLSESLSNFYFAVLSSSIFLSYTFTAILCDHYRKLLANYLRPSILFTIGFLATCAIIIGCLQDISDRFAIFLLSGAAISLAETIPSQIISRLYPGPQMDSAFNRSETFYLVGTITAFAVYGINLHWIPFEYLHFFTTVGIFLASLTALLFLILMDSPIFSQEQIESPSLSNAQKSDSSINLDYFYIATAIINGFSYVYTFTTLLLFYNASTFILAILMSSSVLSSLKFNACTQNPQEQLKILLVFSWAMGVLKIVSSLMFVYISDFSEVAMLSLSLGYVQNAIGYLAGVTYSQSFLRFAKKNKERMSFMISLFGYGNILGAFMAHLLYSYQIKCAAVLWFIGVAILSIIPYKVLLGILRKE